MHSTGFLISAAFITAILAVHLQCIIASDCVKKMHRNFLGCTLLVRF